jgi:hypothetical protein
MDKVIEDRRGGCAGWTRAVTQLRSVCLLALTVLLGAGTHGQELLGDYQLNGNLDSPETGAPSLAFLGNSHFTTDVVDGLARTVVSYPAGDGLTLTNADLFLSSTYSIVFLFRFNTAGGWHRLIDFKNGTTDWGLYLFYDNLSFFNLAAGAGGSVQANSYMQVALTRSASGEVTGYINGNPELAFSDPSGDALLGADNVLNFFRDDLQYPNEAAAGTIARLRLYYGALSPAQVAGLDRLPGVINRQKPILTSAQEAQSAVSIPFRFQVTAANDPDSFSATGLPQWAALDNLSGEISGTPPAAGTYIIGVSAMNAAGSDARPLRITITDFTLTAERIGEVPGLTVEGPVGGHYSIEYVEAVPPSAAWKPLTNFVATTSHYTVIDTGYTNLLQRFYRAALLR